MTEGHRRGRRTYRAMLEAYPAHGYELVHLPRASVRERARFVLDTLAGSAF